MRAVSADDGYRLWAPSYSDETAISFLEDKLVRAMTPPLAGLRLLDAGCGTGRRLSRAGAAVAVGIDPSVEMLRAAPRDDVPTGIQLALGDVRDLPLESSAFDVVWCRLVLGHLPRIERAYSELARVADFGAAVIVSDFHPAAVEAGHQRSFRIGDELVVVEHHVHRIADHMRAARAAGLNLCDCRDGVIGPDVRSFYETAGRLDAYPDHLKLPVVQALAFRKER